MGDEIRLIRTDDGGSVMRFHDGTTVKFPFLEDIARFARDLMKWYKEQPDSVPKAFFDAFKEEEL